MLGLLTTARVIPTRCCSPPERASGKLFSLSSNPTLSRAALTPEHHHSVNSRKFLEEAQRCLKHCDRGEADGLEKRYRSGGDGEQFALQKLDLDLHRLQLIALSCVFA